MSHHPFPNIHIQLPSWLQFFPFHHDRVYHTIEERMALVIELSRLNILHKTGGPFAAAVFDIQTHQLIAPGVNLVVPSHTSLAHAEMVALTVAQQQQQSFNLTAHHNMTFELISSTEPCAMCMSALPWSGIHSLVCGARDHDARNIGFDEGNKPKNWQQHLSSQGIHVTQDICRWEAANILKMYCKNSGLIYNGQSNL